MIIGIAGNINSGKDTVASMLNYIMTVGKNKAVFSDWAIKQKAYDNAYSHKVIHFADIVKLNLANMFSLSIDVFNNRKFKDELWYVPSTGKFIEENETNCYQKIELENHFQLDCSNPTQIVKIRTLMQIYAEDCKTMFGKEIWIKSTIIQAKYINEAHKHCLIPDVRFFNEIQAIWKVDGIVIRIVRPKGEIKSEHISENGITTENYTIENTGTLPELFYKVLALYERIKN